MMVSESQERMLAVVEPGKLEAVLALCERWQTGAAVIGEVTDSGRDAGPRRRRGGRRRPGRGAGRRVPALRPRAATSPRAGSTATRRRSVSGSRCSAGRSADPEDPGAILVALLASPNIASKRWAFEQYDSVVGSRTVRRPEAADAAVLMLPETGPRDRGLDRRQRPPRRLRPLRRRGRGGARVRAEPGLRRRRAARADQLPQLRQPREAGGRLAARSRRSRASPTPARALGVPVVGGNVSLYNETEHGPIYPTPVVGMVGELPDPARRARSRRCADGDAIVLVGPFAPSLAGSELAKLRGELGRGPARRTEIEPVAAALAFVRERRPRRQRQPPPTTSATAGSPARSPRWRSPAGSAPTLDLDGAGRAAGLLGRDVPCSARARGASCSAGRRRLRRSCCWRAEAAGVEAIALGQRRRRADRDLRRRARGRRAAPTPSAPGVARDPLEPAELTPRGLGVHSRREQAHAHGAEPAPPADGRRTDAGPDRGRLRPPAARGRRDDDRRALAQRRLGGDHRARLPRLCLAARDRWPR